MNIIAIAGHARAGKSTLARAIATELGYGKAVVCPIAERLKDDVPREPHETKEEWRSRLIDAGASARLAHGGDHFIRGLLDRLAKEGERRTIIIDDLRLREEYRLLVALGADDNCHDVVLVRLNVPPSTRLARIPTTDRKRYQEGAALDPTERELDDPTLEWDFNIYPPTLVDAQFLAERIAARIPSKKRRVA